MKAAPAWRFFGPRGRSRGDGRRDISHETVVRKTKASLLLLLSMFANAREAAAAEEPAALPLRLSIDNRTACSSETFRQFLTEHVRRPISFDERAHTTLQFSLEEGTAPATTPGALPARARIQGHAVFAGRAGTDTRTIEANTCQELAHGMALVASTWLEAEPVPPPASPPPSPSPSPSPLPPTAPAPSSPAAPERASVKPPAVVAAAHAERSFPAPQTSSFVGGHAVVAKAIGEEPLLGADIALSHTLPRGYELRGSLRAFFAHKGSSSERSAYVWVTGVADACKNLGLGLLTVGLCVCAAPGLVHVRLPDGDHLLPWLTVGGGPRAGIRIWGQARLELEAFAQAIVTGYRIEGAHVRLVPFRAFAPSIAFGAVFPIW